VQVIVTSGAYSHLDLRAPRQLKALARLLLLTDGEADIALSKVPLNIIKRRGQKKEARL
jgi:RNase P/RNase MRP subunit p30